MRTVYAEFSIELPCVLIDDSYDSFNDTLSEILDSLAIPESSIDNVTLGVESISVYSNFVDVNLYVEGLIDMEDEDEFISLYSPILASYLENTVQIYINDRLARDEFTGYLPNANIVYFSNRIFVEVGYHQTSLDIDLSAAYVELKSDTDSLASDLYYNDER